MKRAVCLALAIAALAGCGFGARDDDGGHAKLWITRDRGEHVVLTREVAAGQTAMEALRNVAKVETRYGGRYVQSINGLAGSLTKQRDWLYFINGYEADRGAADYKLHSGDVEWWDYRSWKGGAIHIPVVVGAFPEPFLHGYDGKKRRAAVLFEGRDLTPLAKRLGKLIHAQSVSTHDLDEANVLFVARGNVPLSATTKHAGDPVRFVVGAAAARRLLADPKLARFSYSGLR